MFFRLFFAIFVHANVYFGVLNEDTMKTLFENRQLRSCLWLVHTLQTNGHLTLAQIGEFWLQDKDISGGVALPRRTFYNYRNTIQDLFGIVIECQSSNNTYYIDVSANDAMSDWIISSFNVGQLVSDSEEVKNRILLDAVPRGMMHFTAVVEAFRRNCCLEMVYQKFDGAEPYTCHLQPYCLKLYQHRWYLLAVKDHGGRLLTFALDRVLRLAPLHDDPFLVDSSFSPSDYYKDSFGIWVGEGEAPEILIRAYGSERNYIRTLPLHASQRETLTTESYSEFSLKCHPTRDLMLHLLSHGRGLEVVAPVQFRQEMAEEIARMAEHY